MRMIVMPSRHPVSDSFGLAGFRDVDAAQDPSSYFAFLDGFADAFHGLIDDSVELLRLRAGDAVLDVGCGHGACVPLLARRVGPAGRVVGIDASRAMVAEARRRYDGSGLPVEFRLGDAQALPFDNASFDAARADRVLLFVGDPRQALAELIRVTRPGGRIAVTEGDLGAQAVDATDVRTTVDVLAAVNERAPNGWIGRQLRARFVMGGLQDVTLHLVPVLSTSYTEWTHRFGIERVVSDLIAQGRLARDAALAWLDELRARDAAGQFTATGLMCVASGTREAS